MCLKADFCGSNGTVEIAAIFTGQDFQLKDIGVIPCASGSKYCRYAPREGQGLT